MTSALLPTVPDFPPIRPRGARRRLRRVLRRGRRALAAALLAAAAAVLALSVPMPGAGGPPAESAAGGIAAGGDAGPPGEKPESQRPAGRSSLVSLPVRIADPAAVRLLRPGDRVDVLAAVPPPAAGSAPARVVARRARVAQVPEAGDPADQGQRGALLVLAVRPSTAAALAGAAAVGDLAVARW